MSNRNRSTSTLSVPTYEDRGSTKVLVVNLEIQFLGLYCRVFVDFQTNDADAICMEVVNRECARHSNRGNHDRSSS
jgi:hypothetical protein